MTGESKIVSCCYFLFYNLTDNFTALFLRQSAILQVHKNPNAPFLISGCKVADGVGSMLVRIVPLENADINR